MESVKVKFRGFLLVLYPFRKGVATTYDEWIAALDLATMWDFKEIRKTCIKALSELIKSRNVFDNILLAKKYKVKKWLRDGYIKLFREKDLELKLDDDISKMDLVTIVKILHIRESRHREVRRHCSRCSTIGDNFFGIDSVGQRIDTVYADEIAGMQDD